MTLMLGRSNDQAEKLRAMAKLCRQSEELSLAQACPANARVPRSRVIAITSGKGGVGKTNITANLGLAISALNKRVSIIDADLGLANIDVILKLKPKYNIEHVVIGEKKLPEIFVEYAGLTIIPASPGRSSMASLSPTERNMLIMELIRSSRDFDVTLIDTAAGISNNVIDFAVAAGEVIVVTTPEPTAITDAYAMIKVISVLKEQDFGIVVNMANSFLQAQDVAQRIVMAAKRFINARAHFLGYIPIDQAVPDSVAQRQPLIFKYPGSEATRCINALASRIIGDTKSAPWPPPGLD